MSVNTTADDCILKAQELISEARKELLIVLNEDTWGHRDFKEGYIEEVHQIVSDLLKIKKRL